MNQPNQIIRIVFDGGTSCNIPRLGYGLGYGSYQIDSEPIHRCQFNRPMSANAAELNTALYAIRAVIDRGIDTASTRLVMRGDSEIALKWCCGRTNSGKIAKPPKTGDKGGSPEFRDAVMMLRRETRQFLHVESIWHPRRESVALFGH